jgi:hypothetical protein
VAQQVEVHVQRLLGDGEPLARGRRWQRRFIAAAEVAVQLLMPGPET